MMSCAHLIALAALAALAPPAMGATAAESPLVSIEMIYDPSVPQQTVSSAEGAVRVALKQKDHFRVLIEGPQLVARLGSSAVARRALVSEGRRTGVDYVAHLRLSRVQLGIGSVYSKIQAWVLSPDSEAYVVVSEAFWLPGDSVTIGRQIGLLVGRLIPPAKEPLCFVELRDKSVHHDASGAVTLATTELSVHSDHHSPVPDARVWGHWLVNARPERTELVQTDETGTARLRYDATNSDQPVGDIAFAVDSVGCDGATFDKQVPQREVDRAIALLENARADLDEERDYDGAMAKARRFAGLTRDDVLWLDVLMTPLDAPDRREQALNLLRRARAEKSRALPVTAGLRTAEERLTYGAWFGYDVIQPSERIRTATCDTCQSLSLPVRTARGSEFALFTRARLLSNLWLSVAGSWTYGFVNVGPPEQHDRRATSTAAVSASLWMPYEISNVVNLYGELGLRMSRRSEEEGKRYWTASGPALRQPDTATYRYEGKPSAAFRPGAELAIGANMRVSDWQPLWAHADLRYTLEEISTGGRLRRVTARFGFSYGR